jgi:hypothetical protein
MLDLRAVGERCGKLRFGACGTRGGGWGSRDFVGAEWRGVDCGVLGMLAAGGGGGAAG